MPLHAHPERSNLVFKYIYYSTPIGRGTVILSSGLVVRHILPGGPENVAVAGAVAETDERSRALAAQLSSYFSSGTPIVAAGLDLTDLSDFRRKVYAQVGRIRYGETATYGDIARAIGCGAARAIGGALAANPVPLFIPCHRVLAAGGVIGGWSGPEGLKRIMLELEGVVCAG